jgi:hypothetical protein
MERLDDVVVDDYLALFPEDESTLKSALQVCQRQRMVGVLNSMLGEAIDCGSRADWDPVFISELNSNLQGLLHEQGRPRMDRKTRSAWE